MVQETSPASPLARMHIVRENTTSDASAGNTISVPEEASPETRLEVLEKKAKADPVVQEVMRMFKANLKEVTPKHQ